MSEVVGEQSGQHEQEPGKPNRSFAEVSHISVKSLGAGDRQHHCSEEYECCAPVVSKKLNAIPWIRCRQNLGRLHYLAQSKSGDGHEPYDHHRTKDLTDARCAVLLEEEECGKDGNRERNHQMLRLRRDDLDAFDRAQHRDSGRDYSVTVKQRGADQAERDDDLSTQ